MQMVDDAAPAEADNSKKKHGSFLAHFEKQLWVDNSEQSTEHCSCKSKSTSLLGSSTNMCLFEKVLPRVQARKGSALERRCQNHNSHIQFSFYSIRV